jgi:hypothetical protein
MVDMTEDQQREMRDSAKIWLVIILVLLYALLVLGLGVDLRPPPAY